MFDITFTVRDWHWQLFIIPDAIILTIEEHYIGEYRQGVMTIGESTGMRLRITVAIKVYNIEWEDV